MTFKTEYLTNLINSEIDQLRFGKEPLELYDPIRYIMSLGGKRMRPLMTLMGYSLFGDSPEEIIRQAIAVEVFHNFTLMHDDIMDRAPIRRGQPTVHEKWNNNIAILSGDVMLVRAYDMLLEVESSKLKRVLEAFNQCAAEVCEGQQHDMNFESRETVPEEEYIDMIRQKTAVLLGFSLELGAILAGASKESCEAIYEFGVNVGIGFQLKDDLLDVYADKEKFGKQVGGDIIANKKTFLLITALAKAEGLSYDRLIGWLKKTDFDNEAKVKAVTETYNHLGIKDLTENKMNEYFDTGFKALKKLDAPLAKKAVLRNFTENLIKREK